MKVSEIWSAIWRTVKRQFVTDLGATKPEFAFDAALEERERAIKEVYEAVGPTAGEHRARSNDLRNKRERLKQVEREIAAAVARAHGDRQNEKAKRVAVTLLREKETLTRSVAVLEPQVAALDERLKGYQGKIVLATEDLKRIREEKRTGIADLKAARATKQVLQRRVDVSFTVSDKLLEAARDQIQKEIGEADMMARVDSATSTDVELLEVRRDAEQMASEDEFTRLLAEMDRQQGVAVAATPDPADGGKKV